MTVAVFNYGLWAATYPELAASVGPQQAGAYFVQATLICDNGDCSPVKSVDQRLALLNMLVAHIAVLNGATVNGSSRQGLVGRIGSATEGSVTVQVTYDVAQAAQWFAQTTYGAQYWQSILKYRSATYAPGPRRYLGVVGNGYPLGYGNPWNRGGL